MAKNLTDYNKAELINIAEQLTIPKAGLATCKNSTLITKIQDMAEELSVSIPQPEMDIQVVKKVDDGKPKPRRIADYPRSKVIVEARSEEVKQQYVSINEYTASIKIGEEVLLPQPVIDNLESLKDVVHSADNEGNIIPKSVSRFYIKNVK